MKKFCIEKENSEFLLYTETDLNGRITFISKAFSLLTGYSKEELIGKNHSIIKHPNQDKKCFKDLWNKLNNNEEWIGIVHNINKDKISLWERVLIFPKFDKNGKKIGYISLREEISDLKRLPVLEKTSLEFNINSKKFNYLCILEVENFSKLGEFLSINSIVNLKTLIESKMIKFETFKVFKAVANKYIFFIEDNEKDIILNKIRKFKEFLEKDCSLYKNKKINFIFGISKIEEENKDISSINAELALTLAKKTKNNIYFYDKNDPEVLKIKESLGWKEKTKYLVSEKEIYPYYQPIYNLKTNKIEKYEVLARGKIDGKIISPFFFIKYAEELDLIMNITEIIIDKSFNYFKDKKNIEFSLNITERDLRSSNFLSFLEDKIKEYNIDPKRVVLEILENITFSEESDFILEKLIEIKKIGFQLAIDDFGSDNSNFSRLLDINVDYLKIDGVFIKNINENKKNQIIVKSIVSMAKVLNIKIISEFVENEDIMNLIKDFEIDYAQGYYIGKPEEEIISEE